MTPKPFENLTTDKFHLFWTDAFSQWYPSRFTAEDDRTFVCAEQYMMYHKAVLFGDKETAEKIMKAETPEEHKKLGRQVKNFDPQVWEAHAQDIVYCANLHKFTQNPDLWREMEKTRGRELVEASPYDTIWGIGLRADDPDAQDKTKWRGKNLLGQVLTRLREDLFTAGFQPAAPKSRPHKPFTP